MCPCVCCDFYCNDCRKRLGRAVCVSHLNVSGRSKRHIVLKLLHGFIRSTRSYETYTNIFALISHSWLTIKYSIWEGARPSTEVQLQTDFYIYAESKKPINLIA